jgi:S-DNA-T family DNA segregation ATPase FtsK/SpoIIIE
MQLALTIHDTRTGAHMDVLLRAHGDATVGALAAAIASVLRPGTTDRASARAGPTLSLADTPHPLDPGLPLVLSPLREGAVVMLDAPTPLRHPGTGLVDLLVTAGRGAGIIYPLPAGEHQVAARPDGSITLELGRPQRPLLTVRVAVDGSADVAPGAGTRVLHSPVASLPGATLAVVRSPPIALRLVQSPASELGPSPLKPSHFDINRPPRLSPPPSPTTFALPVPPARPSHPAPIPVLATLLPILAAGGMAVLLHSTSLLLFAALGPLSLVASVLSTRRRDRRTLRSDQSRYEQARAAIEWDARKALQSERRGRHATHPDPAGLFAIAWQRHAGLWRRRLGDGDYLRLRLGTAIQPSTIALSSMERTGPVRRLVARLPAVIDIAEFGVAGVAAPSEGARTLGSWLVAQAAVLHSPTELGIRVLVADPRDADAWRWIRWLPHCRREIADARTVSFAADLTSCATQVAEVLSLIDERRARSAAGRPRDRGELVVIDGARVIRAVPRMIEVLRAGPAFGVHVLCLDTDVQHLPVECRAVAEATGDHLMIREDHRPPVRRIQPDIVGPAGVRRSPSGLTGTARWCESVARALAPLRDLGDDDAALPASIRLSETLSAYGTTSPAIAAQWASVQRGHPFPGGRSVPIGVSGTGSFTLNLPADGPHGLVAGTTGSGKSELLQTIIAAHAAIYRPDELTFVLIDYKGGSAFAECAGLPHTGGIVTDLDPHLVRRALLSLSAEIRRRETLLARHGAKDLESLGRLPARQGPMVIPPRLVIVVDEFATLARELPDFVTGLVGLAQRGRSLGLHLLLATQRPSGVISPEIRANTNLRIALRVTDSAESEDVVGRPDAALINASTPGRAIVRRGPDRVAVVQTGWAGATVLGNAVKSPLPDITRLPWPLPRASADSGERRETETGSETELTALVRAIREATTALRIGSQPPPWLPPLPLCLTLSSVPLPTTGGSQEGLRPAAIGLVDDCDHQRQDTYTIDLEHGGHLLIAGSARSGRSTALRTAAGAIARTHSPRDVHFYGLDCGGGALSALTALPHTGALVGRDDPERVGRLLARLATAVEQRRRQFAADGVADLAEARRAGSAAIAPAYLVLFLDGFEGFLAEFEDLNGGTLVEDLLCLLREGPAAGLRVVLSTDRRGLTGRLASLADERLILRMADPADYALAGIAASVLPDQMPPGRALAVGRRFPVPVEMQVGLLGGDDTGRAQVAALRSIGVQAALDAHAERRTPADLRPFRVDPLPTLVTRAAVATAVRTRRSPPDSTGRRVPLGIGGDDLSPVEIDLAGGPGFVIGGPPRTGRSSALLTIALALLGQGAVLIGVTPRPSILRDLIDHPGMAALLDSELRPLPDSRPAWEQARNDDSVADLLWPPPGSNMSAPVDARGRPLIVLVDDAELVREPASSTLADFWRHSRDLGGALIVAGSTEQLLLQYQGFTVDVRRGEHGLLLSPKRATDGDLLGTRLPHPSSGPVPPGRGVVVSRGHVLPVQVALPSSSLSHPTPSLPGEIAS